MSTTPVRVGSDAAPASGASSALHAGNRALESIARHEALHSLLAFSELREQIRSRRATPQPAPDDLSQTERFVLDEVLQLICDRALAVTGAHGVTVALAEDKAIVCRASSGTVLVERGTRLSLDSKFLTECLMSGKIVRCDDASTDARVALDLVRTVGVNSSVIVPLRGTNARLGVLQAFSRIPFGFTDHDVRSLDLFAELVLSALKPEDQDRRINWLADLATEILTPKPLGAVEASVVKPATVEIPVAAKAEPKPAAPVESTHVKPAAPAAAKPAPLLEIIPSPPLPVKPAEPRSQISNELPTLNLLPFEHEPKSPTKKDTSRAPRLPDFAAFGRTRPVLSVVMGLVAVAALFSVGVWWGLQGHGPIFGKTLALTTTAPSIPSTTAPSADAAADNLMDPSKFEPQAYSSGFDGKPRPKITGVRHWSSAVGSTVVLDLDGQAPYEVHRLMSPERIYFDLHDTALSASLDGQSIDVGDADLSRVRIAQPVAGVTRLVLDTKKGSNFSVSMETNPYRLVIELRGAERAVAAKPHSAPQPARLPAAVQAALSPAPMTSDERLAAHTGKFRIVLDAGHGGWDLGTVGREGLIEKDLVLDVTQRLGKLLEARLGADVVFTRTTDDYLPLEQRADVANQSQAELFVSVHANYSNSANARGVETYYSNFFAAPGSKELNDGVVKPAMISMSATALQEKIAESRRLAASVQHSLYAALAPKSPDIRNRGIKDSAFVVLTGTTMPAILTEISFVSSPADERNLQSASYRQQIAEALYKGIAHYEESAPHVKVAQLQRISTHP
jgi:N-acetylmuramoyl-L-alanine amidase